MQCLWIRTNFVDLRHSPTPSAGIFDGNVYDSRNVKIGDRVYPIVQAWSPAAAVAATQKFIGQREFRCLLFQNGLPWILVFDGLPAGQTGKSSADDGTVVVLGDLAKIDGSAVRGAALVIRRTADMRLVEASIPWAEMPDVWQRIQAGKTVKFTCRINDNHAPARELATGRSASKYNSMSFHDDWETH